MLKKLSLFAFLFLALTGLNIETQTYTFGALSGSQYGIIGLSSLLALLYIIPAAIIIYKLQKNWQVNWFTLIFAFLGGLLIAGWVAGYANSAVHDWIQNHLSSANLLYHFEDAIFAPLIEEPLKLAAVLFALYMVPSKSYKSILLVAIVAGLGFQISEDFSYILSDLPDGFSYTVSGILGRTFGSVSSHWLYTSLLSLGVLMLWRLPKEGHDKPLRLKALGFALAGFLAHFIWNSPLRSLEGDFPWATGLLMTLNIFCFISLYQTLDQLDKARNI